MDKGMKKKIGDFEEAAKTAFDWNKDIETCNLKLERLQDNKGLRFTVFTKNPLTNKKPCFLVKDARLAPTGKASEGLRGFYIGKSDYGPFNRLNVLFSGETNNEFRNGVYAYLEYLLTQYNPISRSLFYQHEFPVLDDGTKVYKATNWMDDFSTLIGVNVDGEFDGPGRYARYLFGDDDKSAFFMNASIPVSDNIVLYCMDEKEKAIGVKKEDEMVVYPGRTGIAMNQTNALKIFCMSDFYTKNMWTVDFVVCLQSVDLKCGKRMGGGPSMDQGDPYVVYPKFNFGAVSSIVLKRTVVEEDPNALKKPERIKFMNTLIFDGKPAPKKRQKNPEAGAPAAKKPREESVTAESLESDVSDCEGEDE